MHVHWLLETSSGKWRERDAKFGESPARRVLHFNPFEGGLSHGKDRIPSQSLRFDLYAIAQGRRSPVSCFRCEP